MAAVVLNFSAHDAVFPLTQHLERALKGHVAGGGVRAAQALLVAKALGTYDGVATREEKAPRRDVSGGSGDADDDATLHLRPFEGRLYLSK